MKTGHGNSLVRVSSRFSQLLLNSAADPKNEPFPSVSSYPNENDLIADVKKAIAQGSEKTGKAPRVLVIGALGRCGSGAVDLCLRAGVPTENVIKWDMVSTPCAIKIPTPCATSKMNKCLYYRDFRPRQLRVARKFFHSQHPSE